MPNPIVPMHAQEDLSRLFVSDDSSTAEGLSDIQLQFLGDSTRTSAKKFSEHVMTLLDEIYKSEDDVLSIASDYNQKVASRDATAEGVRVFRVPKKINDHDLLALKAQGLVSGSGRAVTFTPLGKQALRDRWMTKPNALRANRSKDRFDLVEARQALHSRWAPNGGVKQAESEGKFVRVSETGGKFKRVAAPDNTQE
jgi:hypothetical protein